jgi:type IV pilus assembly protein PilV
MNRETVRYDFGRIKHQHGMTLVEVMVAVFILGFGLLGLGMMQAKNNTMNQSAYYRSIAADLGSDLADRIRAIRTPFLVNDDADPKPGKPPDFAKCVQNVNSVTCANQDANRNAYQALVNSEMLEWLIVMRAQLPNATYTLTSAQGSANDFLRYTLTITWLDNRQDNSNTSYSVVIE